MNVNGGALVTGAGRGLGKAIALELAGRGVEVVAGVRDPTVGEALERKAIHLPGRLRAQQLDLTALGDYVPPAELGILVNNAGFRGRYLPVEEADLDEWRKTFETNFFGVLDLTRRVIPFMRRAGGGVVCNIGSCGLYSPLPFYSSYRTSKAALSALSEGLRIELAPFGIRVLEVPIGGVDTDMLQSSIAVRPPEAIAFPPYQPMAELLQVNARSGKTNSTTPEEAARRIVDAIYADGPLRRPCDENAEIILQRVAESSEEERMRGMLKAFGL